MTYEINNNAYFSNVTDPNSSNDNVSVVNQFSITGNPCTNTDIEVTSSMTTPISIGSCTNLPYTINYEFKWKNNGPSAANGASLYTELRTYTDQFIGSGNANYNNNYTISNVLWSANGTSTAPTNTTFSPMGGTSGMSGLLQYNQYNYFQFASLNETPSVFNSGDEITLTFSLLLESMTITGCGRNLDGGIYTLSRISNIPNNIDDTDPSNDEKVIYHTLSCSATQCIDYDLETYIDHDFITACEVPATINDTVYFINNSLITVNDVTRNHQIDILGASLTGAGNAEFTFNWTITDIYTQLNQNTPFSSPWVFNNTSGSITNIAASQYQYYRAFATQNGISLDPGDTLKLIYKLNISSPTVTGCNRTLNLPIHYSSSVGSNMPNSADIVASNDNQNIINAISGSSVDLSVSKSVSSAITQHNNTLGMTLYFANASNGSTMPEAIWRDTLPSVFTLDINSIQCVASGGAICSPVVYDSVTRIMTQTVLNMPSGGDVTITYNGVVNSPLTKTYTTKAYAYSGCGADCVSSTNFTQTNFQVNGDRNSIGNFVWKDIKDNRIQDVGEPPLRGVSVELCQSNNTFIASAVTNEFGFYSFSSVSGTSTANSIYNLLYLQV
jgi:hypothetical protein